ncbi:hypothetical protein [Burkholderia phage CSP3]|nr:hypothetical protein [Burkholderia phage CSP3]
MQLGTQTASLVNHLQSRAVVGQPEPVVGMGVTLLAWTDRDAGTIQRVFKVGKSTLIEVTRDDAELISGSTMSEDQEWKFTPNPEGSRYVFRMADSGMWEEVIQAVTYDDDGNRKVSTRWSKRRGGGYGLRIGERDKYRDPCF